MFTTNMSIFALPVLLAIWAMDLYLILASIRLILPQIHGDRSNRWCTTLQQFTDPIPMAAHRWLSARRARPVPNWLPWLVVGVGVIVIRQMLTLILFKNLFKNL